MTILQMIEEMQMRVDNFSSAAHDATFVKTGIIVQPTFPVRASQEADICKGRQPSPFTWVLRWMELSPGVAPQIIAGRGWKHCGRERSGIPRMSLLRSFLGEAGTDRDSQRQVIGLG